MARPSQVEQTAKAKLPVIVGPTAVGKTDIAILVAQRIGAEIVSADSRQIYRYMDIGTAKPSKEQREAVPHWMIDVIDPDVDYSAARYGRQTAEVIKNLQGQGRTTLLVGGSGLYIQALMENFFPAPPPDIRLRERLLEDARKAGPGALHSRLSRVDPEAAGRIHPNDTKRLIRALEVHELTGRPISQLQKAHAPRRQFLPLYTGLSRGRGELKSRIDKRVDRMIEGGLVDEVRGILSMGYSEDLNSLNTVGYRETIAHLKGIQSLDETAVLIKKNTKAYAKRQLTWFRRIQTIQWIEASKDEAMISSIASRISRFLEETGPVSD
jgi:tRNA dimethylallyltransferase